MKIVRLSIIASMILVLLVIGGCSVAPVVQREGLVTLNGRPMTLLGHPVHVGEIAPAFKAVTNNMTVYHFRPGHGKVWILSSVPSLDTPVCSLETRHFNMVASTLGKDVGIITISMDMPFAQKRWCGDKGVKHIMTVSDYQFHSFAMAYGVLMKQNGLLARQVVVIGKSGKIVYIQLVPNIAHPPHYAPVLAAARNAAAMPYGQ
ncbi:MAG: thiol peroxidase [Planctomycetia bacterium]|nr:thiol peroxidase [Planctomycetia bacterium]